MDKVHKSREQQSLEIDNDFAVVLTSFEEAYSNGGSAVAMAWSHCRALAEPTLPTDAINAKAIEAKMSKIMKVGCLRQKGSEESLSKRRKHDESRGSSLRYPGRGTEPEEVQEDK